MEHSIKRIERALRRTRKNVSFAYSRESYTTLERVRRMEKQVLMNTMYFIDSNYYELLEGLEEREKTHLSEEVLEGKRDMLLEMERALTVEPSSEAVEEMKREMEEIRKKIKTVPERVELDVEELLFLLITGSSPPDHTPADLSLPEITDTELKNIREVSSFLLADNCHW